ncbi:hypothetical protein [Paenibacillus sp. Y412MC10]|uniref:hypothetical protein n=1 Tax=Geobacillus sp. (strain Y412MC10) TaxID=481743 RepID=UPI001642BE36|nr:hypothetical protein [Paenibacillus sp. Y412MC10]
MKLMKLGPSVLGSSSRNTSSSVTGAKITIMMNMTSGKRPNMFSRETWLGCDGKVIPIRAYK